MIRAKSSTRTGTLTKQYSSTRLQGNSAMCYGK